MLLLDIPNMSEEDQLFQYLRGLKRDIAAFVQVSNPSNYLAAMTTAENVDAVFWERCQCPLSMPWSIHAARPTGPMPMEVNLIQR